MYFLNFGPKTKSNHLCIFFLREMLTGAPGALVKDTKKGNYIVIIALKTV